MSVLMTLKTLLESRKFSMTDEEFREYESILINAISEEFEFPNRQSFSMEIGNFPSKSVLSQLEADTFSIVRKGSYAYLQWKRFLTK